MPFHRFRRPDGTGVDTLLGPEMRSTGEVMGIDMAFGPAFAKSQTASYGSLPTKGTVFVSVANADKRLDGLSGEAARRPGLHRRSPPRARQRCCSATGWTSRWCAKHFEGSTARHVVDLIKAGEVDLVINTPYGQSGPRIDGYEIRTAAVAADIPCITTVAGAAAVIQGHRGADPIRCRGAPLQVLQARLHAAAAPPARPPGRRPPVPPLSTPPGAPARPRADQLRLRCTNSLTRVPPVTFRPS